MAALFAAGLLDVWLGIHHRNYHLGVRVDPFAVEVSDAVVQDLRERIRRTRWPDPAPGEPWAEGVDLDYLRDLLEYWADGFDWRSQERWLNRFEHRVAHVDGLRIHFVLHRAAHGGAPLVLTHGWPSTFVELLALVEGLGDRFDLVVPSLPGYAFSQRPRRAGVDRAFVAGLWHRLIQGLGYQRDYYDNRWHGTPIGPDDFVTAPTAMAVFANEFVPEGQPPRSWYERLYNIQHWTVYPRGGHFAAAEEPDLLASDIAEFFANLL